MRSFNVPASASTSAWRRSSRKIGSGRRPKVGAGDPRCSCMTGVQFARRLGIRPQSVAALEQSEVNGSIQLKTLRRAAEALDCTLVYALVPNASLEAAVRERARKIAMRDLGRVPTP